MNGNGPDRYTPRAYWDMQKAALLSAKQLLPDELQSIELRPIGKEELIAHLEWVSSPHTFDWALIATYKFRKHHSFDFAIWHNDVLCGLCCASSEYADDVDIEYLQGNSDPGHPLKGEIIPTAVTVLRAYAAVLDANNIVVQNALEGAVQAYRRAGFTGDKSYALEV